MVGDTGIEPVTSSVSGKRATAAPIALDRRPPGRPSSMVGRAPRWRRDSNPRRRLCRPLPNHSATPPGPRPHGQGRRSRHGTCRFLRADDGSRTRDIHHGKVVLYQLSYVRMSFRGSLDLPVWNSITAPCPAFPPVRCVDIRRSPGASRPRGPSVRRNPSVFLTGRDCTGRFSGSPNRRPAARPDGRIGPRPGCGLWFSSSERDWRSGSALRSHRRGHWFEPSIAHRWSRPPARLT